jgi:hypothetical protein
MYIFYKIYLQWIYWTLFLSHVVSKFFANELPESDVAKKCGWEGKLRRKKSELQISKEREAKALQEVKGKWPKNPEWEKMILDMSFTKLGLILAN